VALRAALYARVAPRDKAPHRQLSILREFAAARGWTTTELVDDGVPVTDTRRPALEAVLAAARNGEIDINRPHGGRSSGRTH
jgi:DNA invertase Pin-like site-specific DNA recombinase